MVRLSPQERVQIRRLYHQGVSRAEIARLLSHTHLEIHGVLRVSSQAEETFFDPSSARLSLTDREEIRAGIERGETSKAIAGQLGRAPSTIAREVASNGGRERYRAVWAHKRAARCAQRPKDSKMVANPRLRTQVHEWLFELWSPQQIAR